MADTLPSLTATRKQNDKEGKPLEFELTVGAHTFEALNIELRLMIDVIMLVQ